MELIKVTDFGQISKNDLLVIKEANGVETLVVAKQVYFSQPHHESEEIIINKSKNKYFIMDMYLHGESWVRECHVLKGVRITEITNNFKVF